MNNRTADQEFRQSVMRLGTEFLLQDFEQSFAFLGAAKCNGVHDALRAIRMIPSESYPILFRALPKRKPPAHLAATGETISDEERREIERYEKLNSPFTRDDRLPSTSDHKKILASLVEKMSPVLGDVERSSDNEAYFFQLECRTYTIKTFFSVGGRNPELSYYHSIVGSTGDQLNGFPLSLLEMCGLSSSTSWTATANLSAAEILEDANRCIRSTLDIICKIMGGLLPRA